MKIKKLNKKNARLLSIVDDENQCEMRTYVLCKEFISDTQWNWGEIISFNHCDQILSYSTSFQEHFTKLKEELTSRYKYVGKRQYHDLEFEVYQNRRGQAVELNQHPNPQGKMFYLINILR